MDTNVPTTHPFDLTVIIVNYNVRHFLAQCLDSVERASRNLRVQTIVVDNNSVDGSQQMLRERFSGEITLIENRDNPGFSKANNQGIELAEGKYVLLLNPDTLVREDTFDLCYAFMESHPDGGALGVKMLDGEGNFLPESKRALPTPWVSFWKIFGFSRLFPKSKTFGRYHLSFLDADQNHPVEILSGAFMWMRKKVLDQIGGFDETFFMYGEDIDLSYRVLLAGYQNYYVADTQIIHYKGESTKKGSLNYVRVFYQAMIIFARKHFGGRNQWLFIAMIRAAVYFRAAIAVLRRLVQRFGFPLLEAALVYGIIQAIKLYWEHYVKYIEGGSYPASFDTVAAPLYTLVFVGFLWLAGAYKRPFRVPPIINGTFWGFVAIATVSYIFPDINFSRAIVGLTSIFTMIMALTTRGIINLRRRGRFFFTEPQKTRAALVTDAEGANRIPTLIRAADYPVELVGTVGVADIVGDDPLGTIDQLAEIVRYYRIEEIVFDNNSLPTDTLIALMSQLDVRYKIVPAGADYLVGPQAIYARRQPLAYKLQQPEVRWRKHAFDVAGALALLVSYPLVFWRYKRPIRALANLLRVLGRRRSLVGYIHPESPTLPPIRRGLLNMLHRGGGVPSARLDTHRLDQHYARTYTWELDLEILARSWRWIGSPQG